MSPTSLHHLSIWPWVWRYSERMVISNTLHFERLHLSCTATYQISSSVYVKHELPQNINCVVYGWCQSHADFLFIKCTAELRLDFAACHCSLPNGINCIASLINIACEWLDGSRSSDQLWRKTLSLTFNRISFVNRILKTEHKHCRYYCQPLICLFNLVHLWAVAQQVLIIGFTLAWSPQVSSGRWQMSVSSISCIDLPRRSIPCSAVQTLIIACDWWKWKNTRGGRLEPPQICRVMYVYTLT